MTPPQPHRRRKPLQDATQIPELLLLMAPHWAPQDLNVCIQVCRTWHQILAPFLWNTIDDRLLAWPRILASHDTFTLSSSSPGVKGYFWIQSGFTRYGHLIRHLRLSWRVLVDIAFGTGVCTRLESLETFNLALHRTRKEQEELRRLSNLSIADGGMTYDQRRNAAVEGPLLSPDFEGVFSPSEIEWRSVEEQKRDWSTAQNFWSLVMVNKATLRTLRLDRSLDSLAHLDTNFLLDTLATLPHLTELDNTLLKIDIRDVLDRLPSLRSNRSSNYELPFQVLTKSYDHLRALEIYNPLPSRTFFSLLSCLHNLEDLRISEFVRRELFVDNPETMLNNTPTRLKGLHIMSGAAHLGPRLAERIIPWIPLLTSFTIDRLQDETAEALFIHCKNLEIIRQSDDGCTLYDIQYDSLRPINPDNIPRPTSKLFKLLQDYPSLKILDRIDQRLVAADLLAQTWAPLTKLKVFRCQIVNVNRLTPSEETMLTHTSPSWLPRPNEALTLITKHTQSIALQKAILSRLGTLTNLRVLDLGYEWRDVWADSRSRSECRRYTSNTQEYIRYGTPYKNTLELTLSTGLTYLSELRHLQVFGFEGVDHRIGKQELEWMAIHWPKLKIMRGLQGDDHLVQIEPDPVKTELRRHMEMLRPDVKHESLSRQGSRKM
ncbi:hypothetical protein EC957_006174 [Mortierella hygrophila]|uniref:F-box domain-containing protein n=1 Tax=Mortierella hygrophila TaxID=979708 RepID=A0A9P6F035_9FUNG|nr:hypothetical protein EC957_006174 [Mortierella hygrophila]